VTRVIVLAVSLIAATPSVAADQLDLVCKGKKQIGMSARYVDVEHRYRLDLSARKWCVDTCQATLSLASVDDEVIYFLNEEEKFKGDPWEIDRTYRATGFWVHIRSNTAAPLEEQGHCEPAAFSGFPAPVQKF
jgi:hypothetical protein